MLQIYGYKAMTYKQKSMNKGFFPDEHSEISRYSHEIYRITPTVKSEVQ
jgi:phage antirepressor YoqD-like protein